MPIPPRLHFCWIGSRLPWPYVFSILSATENSALPEIILHHTDPLDDAPPLRALAAAPGFRLNRIDPIACLADIERELTLGSKLTKLYARLDSPVMRSDMIRAAILYRQGGIYFDLDSITVAPLTSLLELSSFIGTEYIVWPLSVRTSRSPIVRLRHIGLDLTRKLLRNTSSGWSTFRRIEHLYFRGVNGAVMGSEPGSSFIADNLRAMASLPAAPSLQPYAIGPDLLQSMIDATPYPNLTILDPELFSPLPPEISQHWFRITNNVRLDEVLPPRTKLVHWYSSVRTRATAAEIDPAYISRH